MQRLVLEHLEREPRLGEVGDLEQCVPGAAALVGDGDQAHGGMHALAAGALVAPLHVEAVGLAGREPPEQGYLGRAVGRVEVTEAGADEVAGGAAEHAGEGGVDVQDPAVEGHGRETRTGRAR